MAGLRKPTKKRDTANPNTPLVLFLVFFVILSIGLGVWGYYGYAGQDALKKKSIDDVAGAKAARGGGEFNRFIALDTRVALGHDLTAAEKESWAAAIKENALGDTGKFSVTEKAADRAPIVKMIEENKKELGFDGAKYATSYRERHKTMTAELTKAQQDKLKADADLQEKKNELERVQTKFKAFEKEALARIDKGNKEALDAATEKTKKMEQSFDLNQKLQQELANIGTEYENKIAKLNAVMALKDQELKKTKDAIKNSSSIILRTSADPHALELDISRGKTLWNKPLGKITRVDLKEKQVILNVGSSLGVKPELTFNVFAPSWKDQAEGPMKGTVEVVRVLGAGTSVARITSLYDATGAEIPINDLAKGRVQREADNPFKEGDLLFNMTFGSHVVLAGNINWGDPASDTAGQHMRNLRDFMRILERQGVTVDAYLDLTDGKLKGSITAETRYFVRGDKLVLPKDAKLAEQPKMINDAILAVRNEAVEKGMFIISAENLENVIGYRRPRSANSPALSDFRPTLLTAPEIP